MTRPESAQNGRDVTIRSYVSVRPHPTVVRLEHLGEADADWITSAYHRTEDVERHLQSLQHVLRGERGCGMFLIGQYGSGKSHFLAYLTRVLEAGGWLPEGPAVSALSLLNFRAERSLEEIIAGALGTSLEARDRREGWGEVMERFPRGLVLLIDELSEFLRSKPGRESFNEDVRFLQFLGEWAQGRKFWVLAAMQEEIEHTGELDDDLYRKIKDRFPLRYLLSPAHVRDLIASSVLVKEEGYAQAVEALVREVRDALPGAPLDLDALATIYPLHPAALELMEEVRDRFSQARGVIEFTVTRLRGDPARGIEPFLDRPWGSLIGPDLIVEHFRDLFEFQPEFQALSQRVLPWCRKHLGEVFENPRVEELARRVVDLLILVHLSPVREGLTPVEAAAWLLYRAAKVDPERNVRIMERVLRDLAARGRYVVEENGAYCLDLEDDAAETLERQLEREMADLRRWGDRVFDVAVSALSGGDFDPFVLARGEWQRRTVRWHFHERAYAVFFGNGEVSTDAPEALCIRLPWGRPEAAPGIYTVLPRALEPSDDTIETAALVRLRERTGRSDVLERIDTRLTQRLELLRSRIRSAFFDAKLAGPAGGTEPLPRPDSSISFPQWVEFHVLWILRRRYPAFERFAPACGSLPHEAFRRFMRFVERHGLEEAEADDFVGLIRDGYLVPMGLIQKQSRKYTVTKRLDRHELTRAVLALLDEKPSPQVVLRNLSGPVTGLVPDQVRCILVFLVAVGELDLVRGGRPYRELVEAHPDPLEYERVVPGEALPIERLRDLESLVEGLGLRSPKEWTVGAQRRAIEALRQAGSRHRERFSALVEKLERRGQGAQLVERLREMACAWEALDDGNGEFAAFSRFLEGIGPPARFLASLAALADLPERADRLLGELERYQHLLGHPFLRDCPERGLSELLADIPPPPSFDELPSLEAWLDRVRAGYGGYKGEYARRHDAWWKGRAGDPLLAWRPPAAARSRHAGVQDDLALALAKRETAQKLVCRELAGLEFQPHCSCGFDGRGARFERELEELGAAVARLDRGLGGFFAQEEVKDRVRRWAEEQMGPSAETESYLEGRDAVPAIGDIDRLDRWLSGVERIPEVDLAELLAPLAGRSWDLGDLLAEIERRLRGLETGRLRVRPAAGSTASEAAGAGDDASPAPGR